MVLKMNISWRSKVLLSLGGVLVGLGLAELGARLITPHAAADLLYNAPDNAPDGLYSTDNMVFSVPTPGFEAVQQSIGYAVRLRIDENGLRGEAPGEKRMPRWLALGDSFTMAAQVNEADTFVQRLGLGMGWQVLNGGVDGYGTWQALKRYQALDEKLQLDGVLLVFFAGNDLSDNERWPQIQAEAARMTPGRPLARPPVHPVHAWLYKRSVLYARYQMFRRAQELGNPKAREHHRWVSELRPFTSEGDGVLSMLLGKTRPALQALQRSVAERGDTLVVAVAPPAFQIERERLSATFDVVGIDPATARPNRVTDGVRGLLDQLRIPSCDLVGPLRAAHEQGESVYFTYDGHWSPAGHEVVARALTRCMQQLSSG
jgi:hypothetical protein